MGWTGISFNEQTHLKLTKEKAIDIVRQDLPYSYEIIKSSLVKAKDKYDHNELYKLVKHPEGYHFIMVTLIDIVDNEAIFKMLSASEGPAYYNCPKNYFNDPLLRKEGYFENYKKKCLSS